MTDLAGQLAAVEGFDWDEHNSTKVWTKHAVSPHECEEVFLGTPRVVADAAHSGAERRFVAFGATATGRRLAVIFTLRGARLRVVTARDQSRRERRELDHGEATEADS
jgi:uncharacterized DUF497 family protein